jgi:hypothetical protein
LPATRFAAPSFVFEEPTDRRAACRSHGKERSTGGPIEGRPTYTPMRYLVSVDDVDVKRERQSAGLCADCQHARTVESLRESTFYLCERSTTDPSFPKYPQLPVAECPGYERTAAP